VIVTVESPPLHKIGVALELAISFDGSSIVPVVTAVQPL
jgi:hypothetical protein